MMHFPNFTLFNGLVIGLESYCSVHELHICVQFSVSDLIYL